MAPTTNRPITNLLGTPVFLPSLAGIGRVLIFAALLVGGFLARNVALTAPLERGLGWALAVAAIGGLMSECGLSPRLERGPALAWVVVGSISYGLFLIFPPS